MKKLISLVLCALILLAAFWGTAENTPAEPLDYADRSNWAYFRLGEDMPADVFLICPTVDTKSPANAFDLNEKLRGRFVSALDLEKGIYEDSGRLYAPYYRQMSTNVFKLSAGEQKQAAQTAYKDVSEAFSWYLEHENDGRGIILAGFSQGAQMCVELLKEYFCGDTNQAQELRSRLITVYAIGWTVTEELVRDYPDIVPAQSETDLGTVVSFDCEDGSLTETIILPAGVKTLSINPLNWKTDGTPADKTLNKGAVMSEGAAPAAELCGAYIGSRGELVVTDISASDYPPGLYLFPEGSYHLYDYMFFFMNLKENIALRTNLYLASCR
ncbi:MAG: DUF3089 domain-containing protein [Clostridia bacterium]|nr:DUF3089 domain-containing protein [Clostridia bacterium]